MKNNMLVKDSPDTETGLGYGLTASGQPRRAGTPLDRRRLNRFTQYAWAKALLARRCAPTCRAFTMAGTRCQHLPMKGWDYCVSHTSVRKRAQLGYDSALKILAATERLASAPLCLRELPLWRCLGYRMRVVLLDAWLAEVEQGQHGAWWTAVLRILEWRENVRQKVPRQQWKFWLRRRLDGTGGATPFPPQEHPPVEFRDELEDF